MFPFFQNFFKQTTPLFSGSSVQQKTQNNNKKTVKLKSVPSSSSSPVLSGKVDLSVLKYLTFSSGGTNIYIEFGAAKSLQTELQKIGRVGFTDSFEVYAGCSAGSMVSFIICLLPWIMKQNDVCEEDAFEIAMKIIFRFDISLDDMNLTRGWKNGGMFNCESVRKLLQEGIFEPFGLKDTLTFTELYEISNKKELIVVVSNITKHVPEYFSYKSTPDLQIIDALRMSCCVPLIFEKIPYPSYAQPYKKHPLVEGYYEKPTLIQMGIDPDFYAEDDEDEEDEDEEKKEDSFSEDEEEEKEKSTFSPPSSSTSHTFWFETQSIFSPLSASPSSSFSSSGMGKEPDYYVDGAVFDYSPTHIFPESETLCISLCCTSNYKKNMSAFSTTNGLTQSVRANCKILHHSIKRWKTNALDWKQKYEQSQKEVAYWKKLAENKTTKEELLITKEKGEEEKGEEKKGEEEKEEKFLKKSSSFSKSVPSSISIKNLPVMICLRSLDRIISVNKTFKEKKEMYEVGRIKTFEALQKMTLKRNQVDMQTKIFSKLIDCIKKLLLKKQKEQGKEIM